MAIGEKFCCAVKALALARLRLTPLDPVESVDPLIGTLPKLGAALVVAIITWPVDPAALLAIAVVDAA